MCNVKLFRDVSAANIALHLGNDGDEVRWKKWKMYKAYSLHITFFFHESSIKPRYYLKTMRRKQELYILLCVSMCWNFITIFLRLFQTLKIEDKFYKQWANFFLGLEDGLKDLYDLIRYLCNKSTEQKHPLTRNFICRYVLMKCSLLIASHILN